MNRRLASGLVWILALCCGIQKVRAEDVTLPLLDESRQPTETLVEALLYPGEHENEKFVYTSEGEEAQFCLDSSLDAKQPFAQVYPERIAWPAIGGVPIAVESLDLKLIPKSAAVTDAELDKGFAIRWTLQAVGQDFSGSPVFRLRAVGAEVFSTETAAVLFHWQKPTPPEVCAPQPGPGFPDCDLGGISIESQAAAISPTGILAAVATAGLKPGIDVYDISGTPRRIWQAMFPAESGGAIDVAFSADGRFVVALLGNGAIHRFHARSGGEHLAIPSKGLTALAVPRGNLVAVGGKNGELVLWRLSDGTIEWKMAPKDFRGDIDEIAVSGDGTKVATLEYSADLTVVRLWEVKGEARGIQFDLPGTGYEEMVLNHDGSTLFLTHEDRGLLSLKTAAGQRPVSVAGDASQCKSAVFFAEGQEGPGCSVAGGILHLTREGKRRGMLHIQSGSDRWHVAQSPAGAIVAVGGGHLLLWR